MNVRAIIVLAWAGMSVLVLVRDWSGQRQTAMQELTGIWLLSVLMLGVAEISDELGLILELLLVADVLIRPGSGNAGQVTAKTVASILAPAKTSTPPPSNQGVLA